MCVDSHGKQFARNGLVGLLQPSGQEGLGNFQFKCTGQMNQPVVLLCRTGNRDPLGEYGGVDLGCEGGGYPILRTGDFRETGDHARFSQVIPFQFTTASLEGNVLRERGSCGHVELEFGGEVAWQEDQGAGELEVKGGGSGYQYRDPVGKGLGESALVLSQFERFTVRAAAGGDPVDQWLAGSDGRELELIVDSAGANHLQRVEACRNILADMDLADKSTDPLGNLVDRECHSCRSPLEGKLDGGIKSRPADCQGQRLPGSLGDCHAANL